MSGTVSRRDFLAASTLAGAGLALPVRATAAVGRRGGELRIALCGCGKQGRGVLMENCLRIPGLRFQAICDIWPRQQKYTSRLLERRGHDVKVYADFEELLAGEKGLDAVIIASPDWVHAPQAIAAMEAGLHVYCEKEMSNDIAQARRMVETARRTGRLLQVGHQRRSNPRYLHAKERILDQAHLCGRLTHAYGQWNRAVKEDRGWSERTALDAATLAKYGYANMHEFRNWRWFRKYGGGPIVDLGSHQIDIFNWFFDGPPTRVTAMGGVDYYKKHEWYDNVLATYEYETPAGRARAFYQVLTTTSAKGYFECFMGDEGALQISEQPSRIRLYAEGRIDADRKWKKWIDQGWVVRSREEEKPAGNPEDDILSVYESVPVATWLMPVKFNDPYHTPHLENFFAAVRGEGRLNCPGEVGYETAVTVLKVNQAVAAEKKLDFKKEEFQV